MKIKMQTWHLWQVNVRCMYSVDLDGRLAACLLKLKIYDCRHFHPNMWSAWEWAIFEDFYLSLLLRRHCRNGAFTGFEYLLQKKILLKNDKRLSRLLTSPDKDGHTWLHCAAEGGSNDISDEIIKTCRSILHDVHDEERKPYIMQQRGES